MRPYTLTRLDYVVKCLKYKVNHSFCVQFLMKGFCSQHIEKERHHSVKSCFFLFNQEWDTKMNNKYTEIIQKKNTETLDSEMELNKKILIGSYFHHLDLRIIPLSPYLSITLPLFLSHMLSPSFLFSFSHPLCLYQSQHFSIFLTPAVPLSLSSSLNHLFRLLFPFFCLPFPPLPFPSLCMISKCADSISLIFNVRISIGRKILLPLMNVNHIYRHVFGFFF